jgi:iron-sulfur cluster repair protein YtfE (RIC family)
MPRPAAPTSDLVSRPKGLLDQDHRELEHHLEVAALLLELLPADGRVSASHRGALEAALAYFRREAIWHTRDEELSLFPRLRRARNRRVAAALAQLATLTHEHEAVIKLHEAFEQAAAAGLKAARYSPRQRRTLQRLLRDLRAIYRRHMEIEDRQIFPLAAAVLGPAQMRSIDRDIAQRRR